MAIVTAQQLNHYYGTYQDTEITFTKEVIKSLGLLPKFVFLKHKTGHIPCIIFSTSMKSARVLANLDEKLVKDLSEEGNNISLRYSFKDTDKTDPLNFFVSSRITGVSQYKESPNLYFLNLQFTKRPPDDLVQILGSTLDAMNSAAQRKEERIIITTDSQRILSLESKNTTIFINQVPRNAILRDVSFSGAKVIILGNAKFLVGKPFVLNFPVKGMDPIPLPGEILRHEDVEGRKDICALALRFEGEKVPMKYKLLLNNYFQTVKRK